MATRDEMVQFFEFNITEELDCHSNYTYWQTLDVVDGKEYAIVLGWRDNELCMKLAYTPTNSMMKEYDIDWVMPYDEDTGWVDDTEVSINHPSEVAEIVDWMLATYSDWLFGIYTD